MKRSGVRFCPGVSGLESRSLQTRGPLAVMPAPATVVVTFDVPPPTDGTAQMVTQQSGVASVTLMRSGSAMTASPLRVRLTTDPESPYVGVNVGACDQIVSFAPGQERATATVPILEGAPNPGEVDVYLTISPVDPTPGFSASAPLKLRVMASDALIPPVIISENGTPGGIELTFNKPMDPVQAANVKNYRVTSQSTIMTMNGGIIGWAIHGMNQRFETHNVPLKSASYNAETRTVTIVPRRRLTYVNIGVSEGHPSRASAGGATGLVDLYGNPINQATTPGRFHVAVFPGLTRLPSA